MSHSNKSKVLSPLTNLNKSIDNDSIRKNIDNQVQPGSTMYRSQTSQRRKPIFTTPDRNISPEKKQLTILNTPQTVRNNKNANFHDSHLKQSIQMEQFPSRIGDYQEYQEEKLQQSNIPCDISDKIQQESYQEIKARVFHQTPIKRHFKQKDELSANRNFLNNKMSLFDQEEQNEEQKFKNSHKQLVNSSNLTKQRENNFKTYQKSQIIQEMKDLLYRMQTKNQTISFQLRQNQRLKQQNQFLKQKNKELFAKLLKIQNREQDSQLISNQNIQYKKNILKAKNIIKNIQSTDPLIQKQLNKISECLEI